MAPLNIITILGLAASVLALPQSGHGTVSHPSGTHVKHSGTGVRSHHHPSGTRASSACSVHSHKHSHSHKAHSSEASTMISSADSVATDYPAKYNAGGSGSSDCGTVTSKIQVTVTITAEGTRSPVASSAAAISSVGNSVPVIVSSAASKISVAAVSSAQSVQQTISTSATEAATAYDNKAYGGDWSIASAAIVAHNSNPAAVHISVPDIAHISLVLVEATSTPLVQYTPTTTAVATHASSTSVQAYTAAASAASSTSSKSSVPAQRGVAYNDVSLVESLCSSQKIGWAYNWASTSGDLPSGVQFIPTLWGTAAQFTDPWVKNAQAAISSGSKYLFSFNEPDIASQANILPSVAADNYTTLVSDHFKNSGVKLCAPAVTNGDATKGYGLGWLKTFMDDCKGCQIDCMNIHWYGDDVATLKTQVGDAMQFAKNNGISEVFLSEFGLNGTPAPSTISSFLDSALPFLEQQQNLTGYAYFMLSNGILATGSSLNAAGQTYMDFAT